MATILRAYGWECGHVMAPSGDIDDMGIKSSGAKTGTYCVGVNDNHAASIRWPIPGSPANPSISVWVDPSAPGYNSCWAVNGLVKLKLLLNTGEYFELRWNSTSHTFDGYVNGALIGSGSISLSADAYFHVQWYVTIADAGTFQVKINGQLSIDYSGDTKPQAGTTGATYFYTTGGDSANRGHNIDDLVMGSDGYLGDLRCVDIRPTADTAQDDWTPSAGDNFSTVDETGPSDADYNETNVNGNADELDLGAFDGATYIPKAVTAWARAVNLAATGNSLKVGIDSGGTDAVTETVVGTVAAYYFHTSDANPDDAAEWEDADLEALKLRYEAVIA